MFDKPIINSQKRNYGSNLWEIYSFKLKRNVTLYSDLEYDNFVLVETNPHVWSFCEQPLKIKLFLDGKYKYCIFDMWIKYTNGTESFIEVKYSNKIKPDIHKPNKNIIQINAEKMWCKQNNYKFELRTELEIRNDMVYLINMKSILFNIRKTNFIEIKLCKKILNSIKGKVSIESLINTLILIEKDKILANISWLIYTGRLKGELNKFLINNKTVVMRSE
jgi:hypothetical protein